LRIRQGRPQADAELTEDYNPLEAGLWHTISYNKGCYIGQETIARLNTYQGVKQQLWGIQLSQTIAPGEPILLEAAKVGVCTSCTVTATGAFALGYLKTKAGGEGLTVQVGDQTGTVMDLPFLTRQIVS
jgi:folate-binding protein YgfZ